MEPVRLRANLHELNNVLAIIHSTAELLQCDLEPDSPTAADIKNILDACKRGIEVVQEVREAAMDKNLELE